MKLEDVEKFVTALDQVLEIVPGLVDDKTLAVVRKLRRMLAIAMQED